MRDKLASFERSLAGVLRGGSLSAVVAPLRAAQGAISWSPARGGRLRGAYWAAVATGSVAYYLLHRLREPCVGSSCLQKHFLTAAAVLNCLAVLLYCRLAAGCLALASRLRHIDLQLGSDFPYSNRYLLLVLARILFFLCDFLLAVTMYGNRSDLGFPSFFLYRLTQFAPLLLTQLLIQPFKVVVDLVGGHFEFLTSALSRTTQCEGPVGRRLEKLVSLHHQLAALSADIGAEAGRPLLVLVSLVFLNTTGSLYYLACSLLIFLHNPSLYLVGIVLSACWCLQWAFILLDIVLPCHNCQFKAKEFTNSLFYKMTEDSSNDLLNNERLRLHLIMKREVQFTACGVFPLDNTLTHSMITAATTYLIILIQFNPKS